MVEIDGGNDFYLFKNSFKYYMSAIEDNNYLLFDNIRNNKLNFSLINLDNYNIENNFNYDFCVLLNLKINNAPLKLYLTQNFSNLFVYMKIIIK